MLTCTFSAHRFRLGRDIATTDEQRLVSVDDIIMTIFIMTILKLVIYLQIYNDYTVSVYLNGA